MSAETGAYLTVKAFINNASRPLDCCPLFNINPDASLSHLFVTATMKRIAPGEEPVVETVIPLMLLTMNPDDPARYLKIMDGQPLLQDELVGGKSGAGFNIELSSYALLKSRLKLVADLAESLNSLVPGGLVNAAVFKALRPVIDETVKSTEGEWIYSYTLRLYPDDIQNRFYDIFLIVPVQKNRTVREAVTAELNQIFEVRHGDRGRPVAYVGDQPYTALPYIIIEYDWKEYAASFDPLLAVMDAECDSMMSGVTVGQIDALLKEGSSASLQQRQAQAFLGEKLKLYLKLRERYREWKLAPHGANLRSLLDAYSGLKRHRLTTFSLYFEQYYRRRVTYLEECAAWLVSDLGKFVSARIAMDTVIASENLQIATLSDDEKERRLAVLHQGLDLVDEVPELAGMTWFTGAKSQVDQIENQLYQKQYRSTITGLWDELNLKDDGWKDRSRALVAKLRELPPTECRRCNDSAQSVVTRFLGLVGSDGLERKKFDMIRVVDSTIVELGGQIGTLTAIAPPMPAPPVLDFDAVEITTETGDRNDEWVNPNARLIDLLNSRRYQLLQQRQVLIEANEATLELALRTLDQMLIDTRSVMRQAEVELRVR